MNNRTLVILASKVAKKSNEKLMEICDLASYWDNDLLGIVLDYYKLEKPPSKWRELPAWQKRIFPILKKLAKKD